MAASRAIGKRCLKSVGALASRMMGAHFSLVGGGLEGALFRMSHFIKDGDERLVAKD